MSATNTAYRGYLIRSTLGGELTISKDGFHIGYARNLEHAKELIEELTCNHAITDAWIAKG